ncbi:MAG: hypothetical protein ISR65_20420 [Bacteriovoracaceae bacterium]|nr:hypothetical protein [Bacteriovoracaceae bacterium]
MQTLFNNKCLIVILTFTFSIQIAYAGRCNPETYSTSIFSSRTCYNVFLTVAQGVVEKEKGVTDSQSSEMIEDEVIGDDKFIFFPTPDRFFHCSGTMCLRKFTTSISNEQWGVIEKKFLSVTTPEQERVAIADAIGLFEKYVGAKPHINTANDKGGGAIHLDATGVQMNCIDESHNSTTYLLILEQMGLLKYHQTDKILMRGYFLADVHYSAAMIDARGTIWAVESYYRDNGQQAVVLPKKDWFKYKEDDWMAWQDSKSTVEPIGFLQKK